MQTFFGDEDYQAYLSLLAGRVCTWGEYLADADGDDLPASMRAHESTGRPLGGGAFVAKLEALLGRNLRPGKPGRPKRKERQKTI